MTITIRPYRPGDAAALASVFFAAVHQGAAHAYTPEQRAAWAPEPPGGPDWEVRLSDSLTLVADGADGALGFMTLKDDGYLDLAFVRPNVRGGGIAKNLYLTLESAASDRGLTRLRTEASYPARRFFLKQGWQELAEQQVERDGVSLTNFRMEKRLS